VHATKPRTDGGGGAVPRADPYSHPRAQQNRGAAHPRPNGGANNFCAVAGGVLHP
jgi:hypothetical protein